MKLEKLIKALEEKHESNDTETCRWCESSDCGVDKNGKRTDDPDQIDCYHFLDCDDDCMERLIPAALAVLRRTVEHLPAEPPNTERPVVIKYKHKYFIASYTLGLWIGVGVRLKSVSAWWELPLA